MNKIFDNPYMGYIAVDTPKNLDNRDKAGEWLTTEDGLTVYCSVCNCETYDYAMFDYCSVCGAKMIKSKRIMPKFKKGG